MNIQSITFLFFLFISTLKATAYGQADCYTNLLGFNTNMGGDSFNHRVFIDDVWSDDATEMANNALNLVLKNNGCDLNQQETRIFKAISCHELIPDKKSSTVCYAEIRAGYFFITRDYVTYVNVLFNRWD